jgi:hypothetical protein
MCRAKAIAPAILSRATRGTGAYRGIASEMAARDTGESAEALTFELRAFIDGLADN